MLNRQGDTEVWWSARTVASQHEGRGFDPDSKEQLATAELANAKEISMIVAVGVHLPELEAIVVLY